MKFFLLNSLVLMASGCAPTSEEEVLNVLARTDAPVHLRIEAIRKLSLASEKSDMVKHAIIQCLEHDDLALAAMEALVKLGIGDDALPGLCKVLTCHPLSGVRLQASIDLIPYCSKEIVLKSAVKSSLSDPEPSVRGGAVVLICLSNSQSNDVFMVLTKLLTNDRSARVRYNALAGLVRFGERSKVFLKGAQDDRSREVRDQARALYAEIK